MADTVVTKYTLDPSGYVTGAASVRRATASMKDGMGQVHGSASKATGGIQGFASSVASSMGQVGSAFSNVIPIIGSLAQGIALAGAAYAGMAGYAMGQAGEFEALKLGLQAYSGSIEETEIRLKRLQEVAKLPGLDYTEAIRGVTSLQAAGLSYGLAEKALLNFGNAIALVGGGKDELGGVLLALTQIASKSTVSAEEINQIAERMPQIRQLMKDAFGTANTESIAAMGIAPVDFIRRITAMADKLPKALGGSKNAFENLGNAIQQTIIKVGTALNTRLVPLISQVTDFVDYLNASGTTTQVFESMMNGMGLKPGTTDKGASPIQSFIATAAATLERLPSYLNAGFRLITDSLNAVGLTITDVGNALISIYNALAPWNQIGTLAVQDMLKKPLADFNERLSIINRDRDAKAQDILAGFAGSKGSAGLTPYPDTGEGSPQATYLRNIAKSTEQTAQNTRRDSIARTAFGGGELGRMGVSAVEMSLPGDTKLAKAVKNLVRELENALYVHGATKRRAGLAG